MKALTEYDSVTEISATMPDDPTLETSPSESNVDLFSVLQENLTHARHQEDLRERQNNLYWLIWGGLLSVIYGPGGKHQDFPWLFALMIIISFAVVITSLKLTVEFGNHIAAAARIAAKLGINKPIPLHGSKIKVFSPLPFDEFQGFMALPLRVPMPLNAGFWMCIIHCFGMAAAVGLFVDAFLIGYPRYDPRRNAWLAAAFVFVCLFAFCVVVFYWTNKEIKKRSLS